jgi:competence protein ComEC
MFSVSLTGFVETRDIRERTDRFVLRVVTMESARGTTRLERVRLSVKKGTAPAVGSFVELKARLLPPLTPVRPGSYDFSRDMFFAGIGASGFVMARSRPRSRRKAEGFACAIRRSCRACAMRSMRGSGPRWKATSARLPPRC